MVVRTPVSALVVVLGRLLQVEFQPVQLTNRVKPVPRLAECETELLVVKDRTGKIVDQKLWSEGCQSRLRLGCSHEHPCSVMTPPNVPGSAASTLPRGVNEQGETQSAVGAPTLSRRPRRSPCPPREPCLHAGCSTLDLAV